MFEDGGQDIEGSTDKLGAEFKYHYKYLHGVMRIPTTWQDYFNGFRRRVRRRADR
jgi:hypothetical protein